MEKFFKSCWFIFLMVSFSPCAFGQIEDSLAVVLSDMDMPDEATPSVVGDRKGKAIEVNYNLFPAFKVKSFSKYPGISDAESEFKQAKSLEFKIKVPVILKKRTKIIAGLKYRNEEYEFKDPESLDYPLYENLEDKNLRALSLDFYLVQSLKNYHFFLSKVGLQLNGDFSDDSSLPFTRFIKYTASGLYGWKKDSYNAYGFGVYLSYTFGRPRIYPAFLWNKSINPKWGIEALLPANFYLKHNLSEKSILLGGFDVDGDSYHIVIDSPPLNTISTLELRRSDIRVLLSYEQEIYDFLWFGISGGYRFNINLNLSENNDFSNDFILKNEIENSPFLTLSLFAVPPKSLTEKFSKTKR